MRVLIAYYSKGASAENAAMAVKDFFESKGHSVAIEKIQPFLQLKEYEYEKLEEIRLKNKLFDVSSFDLVVVGSSVWTFSASPVAVAYLRKLEGIEGKNFALFATCVLPGNAIKSMSNILTTKGAKITETLTIKSIFEIDKKKLKEAGLFAESILKKLG